MDGFAQRIRPGANHMSVFAHCDIRVRDSPTDSVLVYPGPPISCHQTVHKHTDYNVKLMYVNICDKLYGHYDFVFWECKPRIPSSRYTVTHEDSIVLACGVEGMI